MPEGGITMGIQSRLVRKVSGFCVVVLSLLLAACGGGGYDGGTGGAGSYTVGGTVSGLAAMGESVVLNLYIYEDLTVSMNGSYTFSPLLPNGYTYLVTVVTSPMGKICVVANGTGTVGTTNVTNVDITCA
jgi:hypothetical protein